jgi:peptidoglycan/LPS O-acetylase OafA/YrhL
MTTAVSQNKKDVALETMRGVAALVVVFAHSRGAFEGALLANASVPQLLNIFFAGGSAVMFFFVLSGFVLSRRFLESESFVYLVRSIAKRYFRLAGPALLSCLISALLFVTGGYRFKEVAGMTHSPWLAEFGYSIPENLNFHPSLWNATKNGLFDLFFIPHHNYYNSPLWTMFFELMGSYIVFLSAALMVLARRRSVVLSWVMWLAVTAFAASVSVYYAAFLTGLGFAMFMMNRSISVSRWTTCVLLAMAILFLGFNGPTQEFAFMARFGVSADDAPAFATVGALILMIAVETSSPLKTRLSGPIGIFLGKLSFPVYLIHFLVLASIGCEVWLTAIKIGPWVAFLSAFAVTVAASIVAALPLAMFDRWWTSLVNRAASSVIPG